MTACQTPRRSWVERWADHRGVTATRRATGLTPPTASISGERTLRPTSAQAQALATTVAARSRRRGGRSCTTATRPRRRSGGGGTTGTGERGACCPRGETTHPEAPPGTTFHDLTGVPPLRRWDHPSDLATDTPSLAPTPRRASAPRAGSTSGRTLTRPWECPWGHPWGPPPSSVALL